MSEAYICDAVRTPIGRYGGSLSSIRADDLGALPLKALQQRNPEMDWNSVDDVIYGCANQAGEDNRNVARMSSLLAGLPVGISAMTINRLCGSGMDAVGTAARAIKSGETQLMIAGGVESMTRAPFVMPKANNAFSRSNELYDTTMGWRFVNKLIQQEYGVESMPETAENIAEEFAISRQDQDLFAYHSQMKTAQAQQSGVLAEEMIPVSIAKRNSDPVIFDRDEHPRAETRLEKLSSLKALFRENGTVTAGNASGINDGACALIIASKSAIEKNALIPKARIVAMATAGVPPRIMGMGPVKAIQKIMQQTGLTLKDMDVIELNEAFAAQALACNRELGLADDDSRINPNGGAIALGHPLGMSGARLITTAAYQLQRSQSRYALCSMCIGVGQGIAVILERS